MILVSVPIGKEYLIKVKKLQFFKYNKKKQENYFLLNNRGNYNKYLKGQVQDAGD